MYEQFFEQIKQFDNITIFRHFRPDGDATFSQFGLKEFIKINFPNKKVKCCGFESFDKYPKLEKVSDSFIKNSLAIILDCSVPDRTDDNRFFLAKSRIIVDHHPGLYPKHAELVFVDTNVSATCELLTKIFYSNEAKGYKLNKKICEFLYSGMMTDSISFKTANTTAETFLYASYLIRDGELKISDIYDNIMGKSLEYFNKETNFRSCLKIHKSVGYVILAQSDLDRIGMSFEKAKNSIDQFAVIKELKIWAVFAYNQKDGWYDGSIRSRRKYVINKICSKYNGGGHKNACGVKKLNVDNIHQLIDELSTIIG